MATTTNGSSEDVQQNPINEKSDSDILNSHAKLVSELAAAEGNLSIQSSLQLYHRAIYWSLFISLSLVMVGYSSQIIVSLYALPSFVEKYGSPGPDGTMILTASWLTAMSMGLAGQTVGSFLVGWVCDCIGRKWTAFCGILGVVAFTFIVFFAQTPATLTAGEVLIGVFSGGLVQLTPLYVAEVTPVALHGILFCFSNTILVIGQFLAQTVISVCSIGTDEWAYRIPFALQWMLCVPLLIGFPFMPETPWYLIHKNDRQGAKQSLNRLITETPNHNKLKVDDILRIIAQTDRLERALHKSTSWSDLFKGTELRRTEITTLMVTTAAFYGVPFAWYCNSFFTIAGLSTTQASQLGVGNMGVAILGSLLSLVTLTCTGRRTLYLTGMVFLTTIMFLLAILDTPGSYTTNPNLAWGQSVLLVLWNFVQQVSIAPLAFVYISEIPSTKAKSKSMALATAAFFAGMTLTNVCLPYMINSDGGNMRGKIGFVFGGISLVTLVWGYFRVPELKGRTYAEIDYLFKEGVSARWFAKYKIEERVE